jgi:hypothetical protein
MSAVRVWCRTCDGVNEFPRNWVAEGDVCQFCGSANCWRTENEPRVPYELNWSDKRFLKSLRIAPE